MSRHRYLLDSWLEECEAHSETLSSDCEEDRISDSASAWSVYIVQCRAGQLYTGIATDVARRIDEHNTSARGSKWCRAHRPVKLVWQQLAGTRGAASQLEARIKKLRRADKLALIAGDHDCGIASD